MDADGIIMREQKNIGMLIDSKIPIVLASYLTKNVNLPMIQTNDNEIATIAVKHYIERGYNQFAFVGYDNMFWSVNRKNAFVRVLEKEGYSCEVYKQPKYKRQLAWSREQTVLSEWLKKLPKPVAVLACNDDRSQQVSVACRLADLDIPEEVAILGVDNDEFVCNLTHPPLSSIGLSTEIAGYEAASVLDRMIHRKKITKKIIPVHVSSVVTRQSTDILATRDPVVAQSIKFIREHVREAIQVEDVVNFLAISRRSLYERFKRTLKCGVHEYIKKARIEYIESLLINTEMSVSQIAYHMGFQTDEHIASYFHSVKGVNPHKFRSSMKLK